MYQEMIESNPGVMLGKPVIKGTRITVELVLEKLSAGESVEQILREHPRLTQASVLAAISYARDVLRFEAAYPVRKSA